MSTWPYKQCLQVNLNFMKTKQRILSSKGENHISEYFEDLVQKTCLVGF